MILQAVTILLRNSITLVILPLDKIGYEQQEYIESIGGRPYFLNAETMSDDRLEDIKALKFSHVLMSPEMAIGQKFKDVMTDPRVKEAMALVVVDEAHLVAQWGRDFRPAYSMLYQIRSRLSSRVPWFVCSATIDEKTLEQVKRHISFPEDVRVLRSSIEDRRLCIGSVGYHRTRGRSTWPCAFS